MEAESYMTMPTETGISIPHFCELLASIDTVAHPTDGAEFLVSEPPAKSAIPIKVLSKARAGVKNSAIAVMFHGAVNQETRKLPVFYGDQIAKRYGETVTTIAIADPSLRLHKSLLSTWYAGDHEISTQSILRNLFASLDEVFNPSRLLFFGGSTGAHPALYHSRVFKNGLCLLANPLPSISNYYEKSVQAYLSYCWPNKVSSDVIGRQVQDNIGTLYAESHHNTVIVLQNSTDPHMFGQVLPFVKNLRDHRKSLFVSEYFENCIGHNYPSDRWMHWVSAAINSAEVDTMAIAKIAAELRMATANNGNHKDRMPTFSTRDIQIADQIANQLN